MHRTLTPHTRRLSEVTAVVWIAACTTTSPGADDGVTDTPVTDTEVAAIDADADGWPASEDCDDTDPLRHPGQRDTCNGVDDDCDEDVDEDAPLAYPDADGDGYGSDVAATPVCGQLEAGWIRRGGDCDDSDDEVRPGHVEWCNRTDDDCDPSTLEDGTITVTTDRPRNLPLPSFTWGTPDEPLAVTVEREDILALCTGTYYLALDVDRVDRIVGYGDVVISGASQVTPLSVGQPKTRNGSVVVQNLTLVDGLATHPWGLGTGDDVAGGLLYLAQEESFVLDALTLQRGTATVGAGMYAGYRASVAATNVAITACEATRAGGGLYVSNAGMLDLDRSDVHHNRAPLGAALYVGGAAVAVLSNTTVRDHLVAGSAVELGASAGLTVQGTTGATPIGVVRSLDAALRVGVNAVVTLQDADFGLGRDANGADIAWSDGNPSVLGLGDDVTAVCSAGSCR